MAPFPFWLQSTLEQPIYGFPPFTVYDFDSGVGEPKLAPYQKSLLPPTPSSAREADDEGIHTLAEATRQEWVQRAHQSCAAYLAGVEEEAQRGRHLEWCVRKAFEGGEGAGAGEEEEAVSAALDMSAFLDPQEGGEEEEGAGMAPPLPSPPPLSTFASLSPLSLPPLPPPPPAPSFDIVEDATAEPPPKRARTAGSNILSSSAAAGNPRLRLPSPPPVPWSQVPMVPEHAYCPGPMNMPPPPPALSQPAVDQWQQWPEWEQFPGPEPMPQAAGPGWFGNPLPEWQAGWFVPAGHWQPSGGWAASSAQVQMPAAPAAAPPSSSAPPPPPPFLPVAAEQAQAQGAAPGAAPQFQPTRKRGRQNKPRATGQGRRNDLY